ncbi:DUF2799 domain-containing protein [Grimontia sp. S25]|uniref:DUF2799 domain-containing protein n=1 Tax=Grimontia sedimenti TaxID=2711294 RepID=A0A6M1RHG4_9GAMM|nr:DUF2799 domain-containing protein [Grimontia sedimenti]NGN99726.1 DUF2799 domain-containing protein [Grimontia sedimenti]
MRALVIAMFVLLGLVGCSSSVISQYAEEQNWSALASYDVEVGNKPRSAKALKELGATSESVQEDYLSAYKAHMGVYCQPENAYHAGILGKPRNSVCIDDSPTGWDYEANWKTGLEAGSIF